MANKVFIVWDYTTPAIKSTLESLDRRPPPNFEFRIPMLAPASGGVLQDVVLPGIRDSNSVLVLTDRPNANVGFETGLAYGLGKDVALMVQREPRPKWLLQPPFSNFIVQVVDGPSSIKDAISNPGIWHRVRPPEADSSTSPGDRTLFLCPSRYEGQSFEEEQRMLFPSWRTTPDYSFNFHDIPKLIDGVDRLIWTIANFAEGSDERDGGENAANGVIAGWFFATVLQHHGKTIDSGSMSTLRRRFHVLRSAEARQAVDVQMFETVFAGLPRYSELLDGLGTSTRLEDEPALADLSRDEAVEQIRALLASRLTAGGIVDLAEVLRTDGSLVSVVSRRLPDKYNMLADMLLALGETVRTPAFLDRLSPFLPGAGREIEQLKILWSHRRAPALQPEEPKPFQTRGGRPTMGSVLGTAHRLDRTTQWGQVLDECFGDSHSLFSLRGESRQGLGLFLERLNFYLTEKLPNHRVYNVPFRVELELAESGADWERRLSYALAPRQAGTAADHLASVAQSVNVFFVLGLQPLHDFTPTQEQGLKEFLSATYPDLLLASRASRPVHLLVPIDYDSESDMLAEGASAAAMEGESRYNRALNQMSTYRGARVARLLHFVPLNPVTFPTWDEVAAYLSSSRIRPSAEALAKIKDDFSRIAEDKSSTFLELTQRLDRHLGAM